MILIISRLIDLKLLHYTKRRKTKMWIFRSFLEWGPKYPWKALQRQSAELRWKEEPSRGCPTWGSTHIQPPNPDTIAYARKILLIVPWYSSLLWGYANAWEIQKWMLTVIYCMEHRAPSEGARGSTQGAKGVCNPIGGTILLTNQYPHRAMSLVAYVAEDGLVSHQWEERPLILWRFYAPV